LFGQAGGDNPPEYIRVMVGKWLLADRLRFIIGAFGYICLLKVLGRMG
jgi:hypothetical protein